MSFCLTNTHLSLCSSHWIWICILHVTQGRWNKLLHLQQKVVSQMWSTQKCPETLSSDQIVALLWASSVWDGPVSDCSCGQLFTGRVIYCGGRVLRSIPYIFTPPFCFWRNCLSKSWDLQEYGYISRPQVNVEKERILWLQLLLNNLWLKKLLPSFIRKRPVHDA